MTVCAFDVMYCTTLHRIIERVMHCTTYDVLYNMFPLLEYILIKPLQRRNAGIEAQALLRLKAADCPWNRVMWKPPRIMFFFTSNVDNDVAGALKLSACAVFCVSWVPWGVGAVGPYGGSICAKGLLGKKRSSGMFRLS